MKIAVIAVSAPALYQLVRFEKEYEEKGYSPTLDFSMFYVADAGPAVYAKAEQMAEAIRRADAVIIDIMGVSEALSDMIAGALRECKGQRIIIGNGCREFNRLGAFSMEAMKMMKGGKKDGRKDDKKNVDLKEEIHNREQKPKKDAIKLMHTMRRMALTMGSVIPFGMMKDMKNLFLLIDYWQQASREDMDSFMCLLLRQYFGCKELPKEKPCTMRYGIYLKNPMTEESMESLRTYWKKYGNPEKKSSIGLMFYGHTYPNDFLPVAKALYEELNVKYNVLPIAFSQNEDKDLKQLETYLADQTYPLEGIINIMPFRLGAGPMGGDADSAVELLKKANVPYFKPVCMTKSDKEEWEGENAINPAEFLISVLLPELDGGLQTYPVGILAKESHDEKNDLDITVIEPIPERVQALCRRLERYINLRKKENSEKKIALICYNYPPGEDNLFGGAFLDTFESVAKLFHGLKQEGYQVEDMSGEELRNYFTGDGRCNAPRWADEAEFTDTYTKEGKKFPIHGLHNGNIFIGLQPARSYGNERDKIESYHDKNAKPMPEYRAFYEWLAEDFQADAIVHIGTHGTLEFLPGKENGMTGSCYPDRLVGSIPHFYYYYVGNPSEAMVAKRRSHATLISYAAPAFEKSGLYTDAQKLKEMIAEYRESAQVSPERLNDLLADIGTLAEKLRLWKAEEATAIVGERELDFLEERLYQYENSLIPGGLHVIGEGYSQKEAEAYAEQIMTYAYQNTELTESERQAKRQKLIENGMHNRELEGLLKALKGDYIPVGPAGDILKNPEILPTGHNLVQFDPRLIPTKTAFQRGEKIAEQTMERYKKLHGDYPRTTAVILWGLETSKTQGETIGQIMYYLGIHLKQEGASFDNRFEIIPVKELNRPRVDVVIHICGFFRDMFPNLIDNFNEIFRKLALLQETDEQSAFAENTRKNFEALCKAGKSREEAQELSRSRIFGPRAGEYGTRLTNLVHDGKWKEASEIGDTFTEDLSYVYSSSRKGEISGSLLQKNYENVQVISQVRNNVEYELTDLDHYYEFYGGLSRAVENVRGSKADLYVADTTGQEPRTEDMGEALERGIYTRLLNPKWIEGMMRHDYHGVQQVSKRFENIIGFAASTDRIESSVFSDMEKCYVEDEVLKKRMQDSNRWAYMQMMGRLMEANNRGYWKATEEELSQVRRAYLEAEGEVEH